MTPQSQNELDEKPAAAAPPKKGPKTFAQTLQDHHFGYTAQEATEALALCISESERTGKATELTLKLKIKPVSKAQGRYDVMVDINTKLPAKEREAAIMFVGPDMNLTTKDPRQNELPGMRVVDSTPRGEGVRLDEGQQQQPAVRVG